MYSVDLYAGDRYHRRQRRELVTATLTNETPVWGYTPPINSLRHYQAADRARHSASTPTRDRRRDGVGRSNGDRRVDGSSGGCVPSRSRGGGITAGSAFKPGT